MRQSHLLLSILVLGSFAKAQLDPDKLAVPVHEAIFNRTMTANWTRISHVNWNLTLGLPAVDRRGYEAEKRTLLNQNAELEKQRNAAIAYYRALDREIYLQDQREMHLAHLKKFDFTRYLVTVQVYNDEAEGKIKPYEGSNNWLGVSGMDQAVIMEINRRTRERKKASEEYMKKLNEGQQKAMAEVELVNNEIRARTTNYLLDILLPFTQLELAYSRDPLSRSYSEAEWQFMNRRAFGLGNAYGRGMTEELTNQVISRLTDTINPLMKNATANSYNLSEIHALNYQDEHSIELFKASVTDESREAFRKKTKMLPPKYFRNPVIASGEYAHVLPPLGFLMTVGLDNAQADGAAYLEKSFQFEVAQLFKNHQAKAIVALLYARLAVRLGVIEEADVTKVAEIKLDQMRKKPEIMGQLLGHMEKLQNPNSAARRLLRAELKEGGYPLSQIRARSCRVSVGL